MCLCAWWWYRGNPVYERELDPRYEHELLDQEVAQGWILNTDTEGRQWVAKQWLAEGVTDGIPHYQGQKKRTWEVRSCDCGSLMYRRCYHVPTLHTLLLCSHQRRVCLPRQVIRDNGLETYEMTENEVYTVRVLFVLKAMQAVCLLFLFCGVGVMADGKGGGGASYQNAGLRDCCEASSRQRRHG